MRDGARLVVELRAERLQRVGEPAEHLLELLLLFLQHADLGHHLLVLLVGRRRGAGSPAEQRRPPAERIALSRDLHS